MHSGRCHSYRELEEAGSIDTTLQPAWRPCSLSPLRARTYIQKHKQAAVPKHYGDR